DTKMLHIWDLRALRQGLTELGLDWDLPPYAPGKDSAVPPLQIEVDLAGLGHAFESLPGGDRTSIGLNTFLLPLNPFNFEAYLTLGRAYGSLGEPQKALADYSMALALIPPEHKSRGEVLFRRSNNYQRLNDLSKAHADLREFAELDLDLSLELQQPAAEQCNT